MELTNSLLREDQNLWNGGDIGMGPDLQVSPIISPYSFKITHILLIDARTVSIMCFRQSNAPFFAVFFSLFSCIF